MTDNFSCIAPSCRRRHRDRPVFVTIFQNALLLSATGVGMAILLAQSPDPAADWQIAAGRKMAFEVASVKPGKIPNDPGFPMDASGNFSRARRFSASLPLMVYINFAYKLTPPEQATPEQSGSALSHIPGWVRGDEFFAVDATAEGDPTKDQLRLMMQSLLADRFKLAVHFETREVPMFALTLVKPGKTGPKLLAHAAGPRCPDSYTPAKAQESSNAVFPQNCGTPDMRQNDGLRLVGARDVPLSSLASAVYLTGRMGGEIDRPVVDRTGLDGRFDFSIEIQARRGRPSSSSGSTYR